MSLAAFELTTDRLRLRPLTEEDRPELRSAIFAHPDVVRTLMGDASSLEGQNYLVDVWYEYSTTWNDWRYGLWGIYGRDDLVNPLPGGLLGIGWLENTNDRSPGTVDIGYAVTPAAWGMGIAFEAAQRVIDYAFNEVGVTAVEALIFGNINPGSVKIIEKLGGQFLGKKPFEEYGGEEWFRTCHSYDIWLIETADEESLDRRTYGACFRTGQFLAEDYLTRDEAEQQIYEAVAANRSATLSRWGAEQIAAAMEDGYKDSGWSHYRLEN